MDLDLDAIAREHLEHHCDGIVLDDEAEQLVLMLEAVYQAGRDSVTP